MNNDETKYMKEAMRLAKKAYLLGEVPVGVIISDEKGILSRAYNKKEKNKLATHHAEIIAIEKACKKKKDWRLNNCTMYVTLEPCAMCKGAIEECRIKKVVYATEDNNKIAHKKPIEMIQINNKKINIESKLLLQSFFKEKRL